MTQIDNQDTTSIDELDKLLEKHQLEPGELTFALKQDLQNYIANQVREAKIDELENMASQYGEFRDETTGKAIDLKAVTLYRIKHRIAELKGDDK